MRSRSAIFASLFRSRQVRTTQEKNAAQVMQKTGINCGTAKEAGADVMVTPCPLCQMQLDMYQPDAQKRFEESIKMPILHLPQLIGLALGFEPEELGIKRHIVDAIPVLNVKLAR